MATVGIRALQQNASAVVAAAAAGETVTITDRGRPVAQMSPMPATVLQAAVELGRARPATRPVSDLPSPEPGPDLSAVLEQMRSGGRY
jgi:antitoxin (DNA-binding transcriptional repressor) of toxin-antitoxin stability system